MGPLDLDLFVEGGLIFRRSGGTGVPGKADTTLHVLDACFMIFFQVKATPSLPFIMIARRLKALKTVTK